MIGYPKTEVRTCDRCCVRQTTEPESSLCARCLTEIVHALCAPPGPKPRPRPPGVWETFHDVLAILWHSWVHRGYCGDCGLRRDDCEC